MSKKDETLKALLQAKLLPLYYHESLDTSIEILQALYNGGIRILEYTNRGEMALTNFKELKKIADKSMPSLLLGIGTIKNKKQAKQFVKAGADFIVCPSVNVEVGKVAKDAKLLWIPGCMTTTEIAVAENAGAGLVKIFPGSMLGPSYINAIKDIFPGMKFMPTGGVEAEENNLREWFRSGVVGVGMGSKLITKSILDNKDYKLLEGSVKEIMALVSRCSVDLN